MKEELVTLLVRKTDESRRNAQNHVESWRKAIEAVREAEKQAECKIALPSSLTASVAKAAQEARVANHVAAVGLAKNASIARTDVLKFATNVLEQKIKSHSEAITQAKKAVKDAERAKSQVISTAAAALSSAEASSRSIKIGEGSPALGCMLTLFLFFPVMFLLLAIRNLLQFDPVGVVNFIGGSVWLCGGWWVIAKGLALTQYLFTKVGAVSNVTTKRQEFNFVKRQAEREFAARLSECEQAIKQAEALKHKAEAALQLFKAKA